MYKDPDILWVYVSLAVLMGIVTALFYAIWGGDLKRSAAGHRE